METQKQNAKCRFVLTYIYCNWDVNGAIEVYDDPDKVMAKIFDLALSMWESHKGEDCKDPEFNFKFVHDDENDNYYDVEIHYPWEPAEPDIYRVYYLREE